WGSFDGTRLNYAGGQLATGSYGTLRSEIARFGGTLRPPTAVLTAAYLAQCDVFFTSALSTAANASLTAAEQSALQGWVANGGRLVVTGDIVANAFYNDFTAWLGVTFSGSSGSNNGKPVAPTVTDHPVTRGVTAYAHWAVGLFTHTTATRLLGKNAEGSAFLVVHEPTAAVKGRAVVLGDHNLLTDPYVNQFDNSVLARNIAYWMCGCPTLASWGSFGKGWPGSVRMPTLTADANPVLGTGIYLLASSSSGIPTAGLLLLGTTQNSVQYLGGVLLVSPAATFPVGLGVKGLTLPLAIPDDPGLCGATMYLQLLQGDAGASHGVAFTPGLRLTAGR
ncbi:MAG: hypothetical protein H6837_18205, partial [Planctomycetes bacterium]|nr:hypothetical protein [Planctomycetota bacterium]